MDAGSRQELNSIIEKLTHSGLPSLNPELLKKLKGMCKSSNACVRATHETVMSYLAKDHAEIRLSAFQIIDDLFRRSHLFRELLLSDFQRFTHLVTGIDSKEPLPLPKAVASKLKEKSLLAIRQWHDKFGEGYPRLKISYNYLKTNRKVNFDELVAQSEAVRRRQEEREVRHTAMLQQRIRDIKQEMNDMRLDIEDCLSQVESCFNLLVPRFDIPDIFSSAESEDANFDLSPPPQKSNRDTEQAEGSSICRNDEERKERERKRTASSCSFVSLSSGEESDDDENEEVTIADPPTSTAEDEGKREESVMKDEDILAHLYTPSSSNSQGLKLGVATSSGSSKGKGKLKTSEIVLEEMKVCGEGDGGMMGDSESDSSSDVEWEDVPISMSTPTESHDQTAALLSDLQEHGLTSRGFSIPITIELSRQPEVRETEDNSSIIATLLECKQLLSEKHLPTVNKWMEWMAKAGGEEENLRKAIDFKNKIMTTLDKFQRLKVIYTHPPSAERPSQDNSEEKMAKPRTRPRATPAEWQFGGSYSSIPHSDMEQDPTTPEAQLARLKKNLHSKERVDNNSLHQAEASSSTYTEQDNMAPQRRNLSKAADAPVVPFGMDLYYWDKPKDLEPMTLAPVGSLHRFWVQEREISISEEEKARLRCRAITYAGEFEPIQRSCRAPLPNGNLCPRRDRKKCPFHGVIIPRDERGNPVKTRDEATQKSVDTKEQLELMSGVQSSSKEAGELWRDIELQNDIMAAAQMKHGSQLPAAGGETKKRRGRKKGERKTKYPGLTDLKVHTDTPRVRLEKKVLNKRSLKRVAALEEMAAAKKYQDKFGYNFNYALRS